MRKLLLLFLFTAAFYPTFAQQLRVSGTVTDSLNNIPLIGANVILQHLQDTTQIKATITNVNGEFEFILVKPGGYLLRVSHTGYVMHEQRLSVRSTDIHVGTLLMPQSVTTLNSVLIEGDVIPVEQKGDTVQYNANAFKTNPDATAGDLLAKMPGMMVDGNEIQAQGENVTQILVDGKRFFADDPQLALTNLPADIIDKIEVFDQLSEQSQFTGFNDGETRKTINIVTKNGLKNSKFGKANAGMAENGRYMAGGDIHSFNGNRRVSLLGNSNKINQQNFGTNNYGEPVISFRPNQQNGISTIHSGGLNYINQWEKKVEFSGSYFFNTSENERSADLSRTFIARDSGMTYVEKSNTSSSNTNHRVNFRLRYNIDSANSLSITPRLSMQLNNSNGFTASVSSIQNTLVNKLDKTNSDNHAGYTFSNDILFRHRFAKQGRSVSWGLSMGMNDRESDSRLQSLNEFFDQDQFTKIDQESHQFINNHTFSSNIAFTERVSKNGQLQFNYTASLRKSDSNKKTYDLDTEIGEYSNLNTHLTNVFKNNYVANRGGLSYRYNIIRKFNLMAGVNFQHAQLSSDQDFPEVVEIERSFQNMLPQFSFNYLFSRGENLQVIYWTATNAPSISQLQNVVNNANPMFLRSGNADLKQDYQQTLTVRYGRTNVEKGRNLHFFLSGRYIQDYIGNARFFNGSKDSTVVNQVELAPGQQLSYPVNVPENWSGRTFVTYGLPLKFIKSNLNLNMGFNYNRSPALVNGDQNVAYNYAINQGVKISSNISKNVDFRFSYTAYYTIVKNSLTNHQRADNNYFRHSSAFYLNFLPWKGLVINSNLTNSFFSGLSSEFNQSVWFWTAAIGYKFLKNKSLEAKINAFDLLNQNKSINREVSDTFIEDSQTNVLTRFYMLTVMYRFRKF